MLYFEFENNLKFYNLDARSNTQSESSGEQERKTGARKISHVRIQNIPSGGPGNDVVCHQRISQRAEQTSLEKQLASRVGFVPEFLRIPIATCEIPGTPVYPLDPPMVTSSRLNALGVTVLCPRARHFICCLQEDRKSSRHD